jgi:hypothetical protein
MAEPEEQPDEWPNEWLPERHAVRERPGVSPVRARNAQAERTAELEHNLDTMAQRYESNGESAPLKHVPFRKSVSRSLHKMRSLYSEEANEAGLRDWSNQYFNPLISTATERALIDKIVAFAQLALQPSGPVFATRKRNVKVYSKCLRFLDCLAKQNSTFVDNCRLLGDRGDARRRYAASMRLTCSKYIRECAEKNNDGRDYEFLKGIEGLITAFADFLDSEPAHAGDIDGYAPDLSYTTPRRKARQPANVHWFAPLLSYVILHIVILSANLYKAERTDLELPDHMHDSMQRLLEDGHSYAVADAGSLEALRSAAGNALAIKKLCETAVPLVVSTARGNMDVVPVACLVPEAVRNRIKNLNTVLLEMTKAADQSPGAHAFGETARRVADTHTEDADVDDVHRAIDTVLANMSEDDTGEGLIDGASHVDEKTIDVLVCAKLVSRLHPYTLVDRRRLTLPYEERPVPSFVNRAAEFAEFATLMGRSASPPWWYALVLSVVIFAQYSRQNPTVAIRAFNLDWSGYLRKLPDKSVAAQSLQLPPWVIAAVYTLNDTWYVDTMNWLAIHSAGALNRRLGRHT